MIEPVGQRRHFVGVGLLSLGLRLATLISKLALTLAMARWLTPAEVGSYGMVVAILSLAALVVGLELYSQANREIVGANPTRQAVIVRDQFVLYAVAYGVAGLVLAGLWLSGLLDLAIAGLLLLLIIGDHLSQECFRILIFLSRTVWANIVLFLRAGIWAYAAIALMLVSPSLVTLPTIFLLWALGAFAGLTLGLFVMQLPWQATRNVPVDWGWVGARLVAAIPFMVISLAAIASLYVDRFFLDNFVGRDAVGIYTLFSGLALAILSLVTASVSQQFLPRLVAALGRGNARRQVLKSFLIANVTVTLLLAGISLAGVQPLLQLVGRPEYSAEMSIFGILVAATTLRAFGDVPAGVLYGLHADRRLMAANLGSLMAALLLNGILIPSYGVTGAAWAAFGASLAFLLIQSTLAAVALRTLIDRA